jgi:hypothetical protein
MDIDIENNWTKYEFYLFMNVRNDLILKIKKFKN